MTANDDRTPGGPYSQIACSNPRVDPPFHKPCRRRISQDMRRDLAVLSGDLRVEDSGVPLAPEEEIREQLIAFGA